MSTVKRLNTKEKPCKVVTSPKLLGGQKDAIHTIRKESNKCTAGDIPSLTITSYIYGKTLAPRDNIKARQRLSGYYGPCPCTKHTPKTQEEKYVPSVNRKLIESIFAAYSNNWEKIFCALGGEMKNFYGFSRATKLDEENDMRALRSAIYVRMNGDPIQLKDILKAIEEVVPKEDQPKAYEKLQDLKM